MATLLKSGVHGAPQATISEVGLCSLRKLGALCMLGSAKLPPSPGF